MELAIISADFEVEIPASIREALGIEPGQRMEIRERDGRIELLPLRPITGLGGCCATCPTTSSGSPTAIFRDRGRQQWATAPCHPSNFCRSPSRSKTLP